MFLLFDSSDDPDAIHRWVFRMVQQLLTPNSVDLTARYVMPKG